MSDADEAPDVAGFKADTPLLLTPDYDEAVATFVRQAVEGLMSDADPIYASLRRLPLPEGVVSIRVETGDARTTSPEVHMSEQVEIQRSDVVEGNLEEFHIALAQIADSHLLQFMRPFFEHVGDAAEAVGNTMTVDGSAMSWDDVLDAWERSSGRWTGTVKSDRRRSWPVRRRRPGSKNYPVRPCNKINGQNQSRCRSRRSMFLADAVAAYVESLSERELDAPILALLHRLGFERVHLVHGAYEFGKDFVGQAHEDGILYQFCLQSKAGDLGTPGWRDVRQQVDEMRTGSVVHPDFDPSLPRRLIVVTNGRLKGGAGIAFQEYNSYHQGRGEAVAELWDIDWLVPQFETVLVEGTAAQDRARTLELLGRLGQAAGSRLDIRAYARTWFLPGLGAAVRWSNVLTAAMLAKEAATHGREDLAAQVAFWLLRAAWENPPEPDSPNRTELTVARRIFRDYANSFWEATRTLDAVALTTRSRTGLDAFITHPVKAARLCEELSLLGILAYTEGDNVLTDAVANYISEFIESSPSAAHPVSDEWAFSLLVTVVLLALTGHRERARSTLQSAAVWLLDRVEFGSGIVRAGETASVAVRQVLGPAYPHIGLGHEPSAYAFTVVLDLAHLCGFRDLYEDLLNDIDSVGALACVVAERSPGDVTFVARIAYSSDGEPPAEHHEIPVQSTKPGADGELFDCIAGWATTRDRHLPSIIAALLRSAASPPMRSTTV